MFSHLQLRRKGILVSTLSSLHIWWKGFPEPSASSCPFWKVAWGIFYFVIYDLIRYGARTKSLPSAKSAALGEKLFLCSGEVTPVFFFCCRGELGVSSWSADRHPWWCIDLGFISCNLDSWEDSLASCLCTFVEFALNLKLIRHDQLSASYCTLGDQNPSLPLPGRVGFPRALHGPYLFLLAILKPVLSG